MYALFAIMAAWITMKVVLLCILIVVISNDLVEMRKLRKMGHITIVGPSMHIVKARLDLMLSGKSLGGNTPAQVVNSLLLI